jgi:hypothetical protein
MSGFTSNAAPTRLVLAGLSCLHSQTHPAPTAVPDPGLHTPPTDNRAYNDETDPTAPEFEAAIKRPWSTAVSLQGRSPSKANRGQAEDQSPTVTWRDLSPDRYCWVEGGDMAWLTQSEES